MTNEIQLEATTVQSPDETFSSIPMMTGSVLSSGPITFCHTGMTISGIQDVVNDPYLIDDTGEQLVDDDGIYIVDPDVPVSDLTDDDGSYLSDDDGFGIVDPDE